MLFLDTETYSETPLKHGTYRYAEGCEVVVISWAVDEGAVTVLDLTDPAQAKGPPMRQFLDDLEREHDVVAHNAMFDRNVLRLSPLGLDIPIARWQCSMVCALAHGLPGSLDTLGPLLGVPVDKQKLKDGKALIQLFCKPRPKNQKLRRATRETHPREWARFLEYAANDIEALRAIWRNLPAWNWRTREQELYHLDQEINDRGFQADVELAHAAQRAAEREQARLASQCQQATRGEITATSQRDRLLAFLLADYGVGLPDLRADTIERRLGDPELPEGVREVLTNRLAASSTSTAKYGAILRAANPDGRVRGTIQFNGAARTRRAAGRVFQPQNLPSRGLLPPDEIELGIEAMKLGCEHLLVEDVMRLTVSTIRSVVIAPPGKKLVVADLANIEGRDAAWLAGEDWKLDAFRQYDRGTGPDLYNLAYAKSFRCDPVEVTKTQRQIGKVQELFMQYEGGVGAFITGAETYGIDLDDMAEKAWPALPYDIVSESEDFHNWLVKKNGNTYGLKAKTFIVCDSLKRAWRLQHGKIVALWRGLEETAIEAVKHPGTTLEFGRFKFRREGQWLRIQLPSKRALCYPSPQVDDKGKLTYMGQNQYTRKWCRLHTYGGKLFENACQSFARDILFDSMLELAREGYDIVLHVHDEVVLEVPDTDEFTLEGACRLLAASPTYAPDLPLAAAGFETYRYRKE